MANQSHIESAPMNSNIAGDNDGNADGHAVKETSSHKRKADFDDNSVSDDEEESGDDSDCDEVSDNKGREEEEIAYDGEEDDGYEGSEQQEKDYQEYLKIVKDSEGFEIGRFQRELFWY
ncbi:uncharacterized protein LOC126660129 [Mercurialis annua]|uniref:uncharacterized protein LOC126660129 n=1 Tax=Mercurialis annua TaxID=3986 RepID=UPI0024AEFFBB|nr:uncharacterized protein LOC126660129 [Mercurialis annua]